MGCASSRISKGSIKPMLTRPKLKTKFKKSRRINRWNSTLPTVFEVSSEFEYSKIVY